MFGTDDASMKSSKVIEVEELSEKEQIEEKPKYIDVSNILRKHA